MSINLTDELLAKTKKGKIASAKQVFLEGDQENLQQIGDKTHQLEDAFKDIAVSGGASTANAVSYNNETSGMTAITAQGAIDELASKNKVQDATIGTKVDKEEGKSLIDSEVAAAYSVIDNPEFMEVETDSNGKVLSGTYEDGSHYSHNMKSETIDEKVDKEEGKSLIDSEVAAAYSVIDNPEFMEVETDSNGKVLSGTYEDGSHYSHNMKSETIDEKVDKEEGKSLIDSEVAAAYSVIDNPEFMEVETDSNGKVLSGTYEDGSHYSHNMKSETIDEKVDKEEGKSLIDSEVAAAYSVIDNPEFMEVETDSNGKVLSGTYEDGSHYSHNMKSETIDEKVDKEEGKSLIDSEVAAAYSVIDNPEFMEVETDSNGKVLSGTYEDGSHYSHNMKSETIDEKVDKEEGKSLIDSEVAAAYSVIDNPEFMEVETDSNGKVLSGTYEDGSHYSHNMKSETIPEEFSHLEDPEGRMEIETDADNKILAYRDSYGVKHETNMQVDNFEVENLNLKGNSVHNIEDALKANGFYVNIPIDWSEKSFIQIQEPRFAIANVTGITAMPTSKTQNLHAWMEFWDMQGNYFKKRVILNAQGNSSMGFVKKNASVDICNDEWIGDDTAKIRFGNWVPQDSFHLKAYYTDFFRGVSVVSYKLYEQIVKTRGNMYDKPWKKALINMDTIGVTTKSIGNPLVGRLDLQTDTGALCHPDGFPMALYLNGEFYGIFSWQLKKHRDNYHMDKSLAEHIHLDGEIQEQSMFGGKENIKWDFFEIRNPKGLYSIGGNKYDADIRQEEIAGETEINSWIEAGNLPDGTEITSKIKKNLQMTAKVKKYIQNLADADSVIKTAENIYKASSKTEEDLKVFKKVFERYFDTDNIIDFQIVSDIINNTDGMRKNWQWLTYDGKKWWIEIYDCDVTFGALFTGEGISKPMSSHVTPRTSMPNGYVLKYYSDAVNMRYKFLADNGIISSDNISGLLIDWTMRIGTSFYEEEYKKWKQSPCIGNSEVRNDYWEVVTDEHGNPQTDSSETFDATQAYEVGNTVSFGRNSTMGFFKFKCIKQTVAQVSNTPHQISPYSPIKVYRHCDNLYRIQKWIEESIANMNKLYLN